MALLNADPFRSGWRGRWQAGALALLLLVAASLHGGDTAAPSGEYQVKAVFLFTFAQFAEWPAAAFADPHDPLVIGVLGDDPFGPYLDELVAGEKVGERPLVVRRPSRLSEAEGCHILFVSRSEAARLEAILAALKRKPVLTIGDADAFAARGGMVRFVMERGKVRLRVNVEAAKAAGITISSKILRPATIVTPRRK